MAKGSWVGVNEPRLRDRLMAAATVPVKVACERTSKLRISFN